MMIYFRLLALLLRWTAANRNQVAEDAGSGPPTADSINADATVYSARGRFKKLLQAKVLWKLMGGEYALAIGSNCNVQDWKDTVAGYFDRKTDGTLDVKPGSVLEKLTAASLPHFQESLLFVGSAELPGYYLTFSGISEARQYWGVADAKAAADAKMYGALMRIRPKGRLHVSDVIDLLRYKEGFPYQYQEAAVSVRVLDDHPRFALKKGDTVPTTMYVFNPPYWLDRPKNDAERGSPWFPLVPFPPSDEYIDVVSSAVAQEFEAPAWSRALMLVKVLSTLPREQLDLHFEELGRAYQASADPVEDFPLLESYRNPAKWDNWFCTASGEFISRETVRGERPPSRDEWRIYGLMAVQERYGANLLSLTELEEPETGTARPEDGHLLAIAGKMLLWAKSMRNLGAVFASR